MTADQPLIDLALEFATIGRALARLQEPDAVFTLLCETAVQRVPGAQYAGVTVVRKGLYLTVGATAEAVDRVDAIQYELLSGPCIEVTRAQDNCRTDDLRVDERWPEFGPRAYETAGVVSMFAQRLFVEDDESLVAGLNMYSTQPFAFDEPAASMAVLLATHGAIAVAFSASRVKAENLTYALRSSREIGIAMGIIMNRLKVTRDQAFDLLRIASQHTHRKVAAIAQDVADTGQLPVLPGDSHKVTGS